MLNRTLQLWPWMYFEPTAVPSQFAAGLTGVLRTRPPAWPQQNAKLSLTWPRNTWKLNFALQPAETLGPKLRPQSAEDMTVDLGKLSALQQGDAPQGLALPLIRVSEFSIPNRSTRLGNANYLPTIVSMSIDGQKKEWPSPGKADD